MPRQPKERFKGIDYFIGKVGQWSSLLAFWYTFLYVVCERRRRQTPGRTAYLDITQWGRRFLPAHFSRPPSKMHRWLSDRLQNVHQRRGTKINVIGPRGGAKSTIGTLGYVLRAALEGWEPYIWIVSDTASQAQTHLRNVKTEITGNEFLARAYPRSCGEGPRWQVDSITLRNGVVIECFGTLQKVRGRREAHHRPSLIVCDDIENDQQVESASQRKSSHDWFHSTLVNAGDKDTNMLSLATALHHDALAMRLCSTPGWDSRVFRSLESWPVNMWLWKEWEAIYSDTRMDNPKRAGWNFYQRNRSAMDEGADVLWPAEEDLYTLMQKRLEGGHAAFEREKQNSPTNHERCEWPAEYFDDSIWFDRWPDDLQVKVIAHDPSKGRDAEHGDYSAFVVLGVDMKGLLYVEADLARRDTARIVADGIELCQRHRPTAFGVEANQFQELLADQFVSEFAREGIFWCVPMAIHNQTNKLVRIRRLGPYLAQRRLRFRSSSSGTDLLVEQLRDFPCGAHDDGPDALEMAVRLAGEVFGGTPRDDGLGERLVGDI